jgi:hypothetical protein
MTTKETCVNQRKRNKNAAPRLANLRHEIAHRYIRPAMPQLNGKEGGRTGSTPRSSADCVDGVMIDGTQLFNDKLAEWEVLQRPPPARRPRRPDLSWANLAVGRALPRRGDREFASGRPYGVGSRG